MTDKIKEALRLALEALKSDPISHAGLVNTKKAIAAIREALAEHPAIKQALTPEQPAQQEPEGWNPSKNPMTAERAAYFMRRFKHEEKLLGPNEQSAVDYVIAMLEQPAQQHARDAVTWTPETGYVFTQPAQPQQEPVGKIVDCDFVGNSIARFERHLPLGTLLYTSPPAQRKPLTGEQIRALWEQEAKPERSTAHFFTAFARAIEAAHGIKGDA